MKRFKIGLIKETKTPPDQRVALPPELVVECKKKFPDIDIVLESSELRCFPDHDYLKLNIPVVSDPSEADLLVGIKEVDIRFLIPGKTYLFFAHVAKKQFYNRELLREILKRNITLLDYEYLTDMHGARLIAFGRWAGIVGAYNGLRAWGLRTGRYKLRPAHQCFDHQEMLHQLNGLDLGPIRILVSGGGRVARGAMETLKALDIPIVPCDQYLQNTDKDPLICRVDPWDYVTRKDGEAFELAHFFSYPSRYRSTFLPYTQITDLYIAAHFWDPESPPMWTKEDARNHNFRIRTIADISCDINGSVPSTIRATEIADPFYGFDRFEDCETAPFGDPDAITMMTIDNLPGELPRDASNEFGRVLMEEIIPCIVNEDPCEIIERATITRDGKLTERFSYLEKFVEGEE